MLFKPVRRTDENRRAVTNINTNQNLNVNLFITTPTFPRNPVNEDLWARFKGVVAGVREVSDKGKKSSRVGYRISRASPARRVTRWWSRYSSSGIAYLREIPVKSLNAPTSSF